MQRVFMAAPYMILLYSSIFEQVLTMGGEEESGEDGLVDFYWYYGLSRDWIVCGYFPTFTGPLGCSKASRT